MIRIILFLILIALAGWGASWVAEQPAVSSPIVGATKLSHLDDAVAAVQLDLTDAERALLAEHYIPHAVAGF